MSQDYDLIQRAKKIIDMSIRVFEHSDFNDKSKISEILADMPNAKEFFNLKKKVLNLRKNKDFSPEMRPCYEDPLLTKEQEYHLFRKMNYYKYKAKLLRDGLNIEKKLSKKRIEKIEYYISKAIEIRNQIANCNFRLATHILRKNINHLNDQSITEVFLSDAYLDVLKSVDYFNYNLGNKFSTYCTWVIKKNFFRAVKTHQRLMDNQVSLSDQSYLEQGFYEENNENIEEQENLKIIRMLMENSSEDKKYNVSDINRQIYIIKNYFGLEGKDKRTLEQISKQLGITKERVRQLKEKFIRTMRESAYNLGFEQLP